MVSRSGKTSPEEIMAHLANDNLLIVKGRKRLHLCWPGSTSTVCGVPMGYGWKGGNLERWGNVHRNEIPYYLNIGWWYNICWNCRVYVITKKLTRSEVSSTLLRIAQTAKSPLPRTVRHPSHPRGGQRKRL